MLVDNPAAQYNRGCTGRQGSWELHWRVIKPIDALLRKISLDRLATACDFQHMGRSLWHKVQMLLCMAQVMQQLASVRIQRLYSLPEESDSSPMPVQHFTCARFWAGQTISGGLRTLVCSMGTGPY